MRWGRKNIILIIGTVCCAVSFACFNYARADYTVKVGATIDSKVSAINSRVELSANETMADPENHPILMTVYLFDADGNAVPNITVESTSDRGNIDIIELFTGDGQTLLNTNSGKSNESGIIRFRLSSYTPGDATFKIMVDTVLPLPEQKIKFTPLPFPGNIEVSVEVPPAIGGGKISIIPGSQEKSSSGSQVRDDARKASNIGTTLYIPFWLFILTILLGVILPFLLVIILFLTLKTRRQQKKEISLLEQIAQAEHIDQIKYFVENKDVQSRNKP